MSMVMGPCRKNSVPLSLLRSEISRHKAADQAQRIFAASNTLLIFRHRRRICCSAKESRWTTKRRLSWPGVADRRRGGKPRRAWAAGARGLAEFRSDRSASHAFTALIHPSRAGSRTCLRATRSHWRPTQSVYGARPLMDLHRRIVRTPGAAAAKYSLDRQDRLLERAIGHGRDGTSLTCRPYWRSCGASSSGSGPPFSSLPG